MPVARTPLVLAAAFGGLGVLALTQDALFAFAVEMTLAFAFAAYALGRWWIIPTPAVLAVVTSIGITAQACPEIGECQKGLALYTVWALLLPGPLLASIAGVVARKIRTNTRRPGPGWYPDPDDPGRARRYWDGTSWTMRRAER